MRSQQLQSNQQLKQLPPNIEELSSFQFGKLVIQLNISQLQQINVRRFQFEFLGGKSGFIDCREAKRVYEFSIGVTLWHFYQYLKDMGSISIKLQSSDFQQLLTCTKILQLLSPSKVLNRSYVKGNYIANSVELCDIYTENQQNKGYVMFKVKLEFDEDIHKEILDVIDFQALLNNPEDVGEGRKQFAEVFSNQAQKSSFPINSKQTSKQSYPLQNQQNLPHSQNTQHQFNLLSTIKTSNEEQQSRMIEDDIDRMIAEIQNKPYDCSRYLDNSQSMPANNNAQNFHATSFVDTQPVYPTNFQQTNISLSQSMAYDPRINRFNQQNHQRNQNFINKSQQRSRSPLMNRKYPPMPLYTQNQMPSTTIYSQSQRSLSPGPGRSRSLNKSQQIPYQRSMKSISSMSMTGSAAHNQSSKGKLKIQIHELLGWQLDINDCILRVFMNNDYDDIFTCKGSQQGEVILYNQKVQLNECQLCEIEKLRFELQNWQGKCLYSVNFSIQRLLNIPKLQGIFMLNLHNNEQQFYGSHITASQTVLRRIEKPPGQKSLRITVSYTEQVEVIQIYLNLSKFSLNFNKCKYKIPFTKETVEFDPTQTHFNIFPHSKVYQKLMIEFWDEKSILGVSQVNLYNLRNISKSVLECNIQPVYLYDCIFPIKNIMSQNQVGKFKLLVCCGNVRQVQHVLNKSMLNRTTSMTEMSNFSMNNKTPIEVEYDKKLGVFIKDRKVRQEIQIQVDEKEIENSHKQSLSTERRQNEHQISMMSENEFLQNPIKDNNASRVHSNNLNQQQEIDDDNDDDKNNQLNNSHQSKKVAKQQQKQLISPSFKKKQSLKASTYSSKLPQVIQQKKQLQQKPQKQLLNLQQVICKTIQVSFIPLTQNNFTCYQQLKKSCKPHLLFNFIDIDILIKHMMEIGVSRCYITQILEILQPQNGMVNFNLLNDFMMSVQVEGEVKANLVPGRLFVKLALEEYYRRSCIEIQLQEREFGQNNGDQIVIGQKQQWLTPKYLQRISTLDESIDFNEIRKLFHQIGLKISMNDYTILKNFLENQKEIKNFLFQLAQSKTAYQTMIKSQTNLYQILKLTAIQEIVKRKKQQEINKKYQENILEKLYNSKVYGQFGNESKIEEKSTSNLNESRASNFSLMEDEFKQTMIDYSKIMTKQSNQQPNNSDIDWKNQQASQQQDDDDFIIANLNVKPPNKIEKIKPATTAKKEPKISKRFQSSDDQSQVKQIIQVQKFKEKAPEILLSKAGQTIMRYSCKRRITVSGLESCKTTYQCQFDQELCSPFLKVVIENPFEKKLFFKDSDDCNWQQYEVPEVSSGQDQEIQGQIILCDVSQKGEIQISLARFIVIKGIKSVYALKTLTEQSFSGLVNIIIE